MAAGNITIRLNLDDDKFSAKITGATSELLKLKKTLLSNNGAFKGAARHTKTFGSHLRDATIVMGLAASAMRNLNMVIFGLPRSILRANAELEKMQFLMAGLNTSAEGFAVNMVTAAGEVKELFKLSSSSPFDVSSITDSFVKMKAAGLDPLSGELQGLIDSVAKFGGSSPQLKRASIAIQQMAGKGVISMEELRQQLGEAVPNAMMIMSRATSMSMGEMVRVISEGRMEATSALKLLARQMQIENVGSALILSQTFDGLVNRLKNSMTELAKVAGDADFFAETKFQLNNLIEQINNNPVFAQMAIDVGQSMAAIIRAVADFVENGSDMVDIVVTLTKAIIALKVAQVAWLAVQRLAPIALTGYTNASKGAVAAIGAQVTAMNIAAGATRKLNTANIAAAARIAGVGGAIKSLAGTFIRFAGPMIAVTAAVYALERAYYHLIGKKEELAEINEMEASLLSNEDIDKLERERDRVRAEIRAAERARADAGPAGAANPFKGDNFRTLEELERLEGSIQKMTDKIQLSLAAGIERKIGIATREGLTKAAIALQPLANTYQTELEKVRKEIFKAEENNEPTKDLFVERGKLEKILAEESKGAFNLIIAEQQSFLDLNKKYGEELNKDDRRVIQGVIANVKKARDERTKLLNEEGGMAELLAPRGSKNQLDKYSTAILSFEKKLAKLNATANSGSPILAQLNARLKEGGDFSHFTAEQADALRLLAEEIDGLEKAAKAEKALEQLNKRISKTGSQILKLSKQNETNNPWIKAQASVMQYTLQIKDLQSEIEALRVKFAQGNDTVGLELGEAQKRLQTLLEASKQAGLDKVLSKMADDTRSINNSLLSEGDRLLKQYQDQVGWVDTWTAAQKNLSATQLAGIQKYKDALREQMQTARSWIKRFIADWSDTTDEFSNLWENALTRFVDSLATAFVEGKFEVKDFVKFLAKEIIKIQLMKLAAGIAGQFSFGATPSPAASGSPAPGGITDMRGSFFAKGGIMSGGGPMTLNKYARGGIADRPQLAMFGEGSMNEAYVPLPDGRSIPVTMKGGMPSGETNVQVNVINQTQNEVTAEQGEGRFDGKQFVLDVVLKSMSKPGPMRDMVRNTR